MATNRKKNSWKKPGKYNKYDFIQVSSNSSRTNFRINFETLWPLLEGWYKRKPWFLRFFENISASFWYLFMKSILIARSYLIVLTKIKILIMTALLTLGHWFFLRKISLMYIFIYVFTCSKILFHDIKLWANNQYNADQIFAKSFSVVLISVFQYLNIDVMTSPSILDEVTWPGAHIIGRSVFYKPGFGAILRHFYRLFYKIANL